MADPFKRFAAAVARAGRRGGLARHCAGIVSGALLACCAPGPGGDGAAAAGPPGPPVAALRAAALRDATDRPGAFLELLDEWIYQDLVADLANGARPPRSPLPLPELQRSLGSLNGLVALHAAGNQIFGALVTGEEVRVHVLDNPRFPVMISRLRRSLDSPAISGSGSEVPGKIALGTDPSRPDHFDEEAAAFLFGGLLGPFADALAPLARLRLVPSGTLRGIPFELLLLRRIPDLAPADRAHILKRWAISYEPTIGAALSWPGGGRGLRRIPEEAMALPLRLGDAPLEPGTLAVGTWGPPERLFALALHLARSGARGALLGPPREDLARFLVAFQAESSAGRRPDAGAVRRLRLQSLGRGEPIDRWAWPILFGAP